MSIEQDLKEKISFLQQELRTKEAEVSRYRSELHRANGELEKIITDLKQELRLASQVQKILSPTEIPNIPGLSFSTKFVPGLDQGGDYFDIFEHEDRMKFGIVLACSTGYSMSALFLSVLIKMSSQIEARRGVPPEQTLSQMAKELVPNIENKDTASVFYGVIDRRTFRLTFSSVGALAGFLLPHGGETVTKLLPSTGPFSKTYNGKPLAQSLQLNARDRLILCSEGVFTATNSLGDIFGVQRMTETVIKSSRLSVHDMRNEILLQGERFTETQEPERDKTVIVMEVKDGIIKLV